jgi:hypothetical protein
MQERQELVSAIEAYLSGSLPLPDFWKTFTFTWADAPEGAFTEPDWDFFSRVNDELHHADWESPADPALREENDFRAWLREAYARYQPAG